MGTFFALILAPILALAAVILALVWVTNRMADRLVGRKHRWLEEILRTGAAPADWPARGGAVQAANLRRLDELTRYVAASPLVSDEETRETVLAQLAEVRAAWSAQAPDHPAS